MRRKHFRAVAAVALLFTLPAIASAQHSKPEKKPMKNIVQVALDAGSFHTLTTALAKAGLVEALEGPGPFTVFAPTDAAFAQLPSGAVDGLLANKEKLASVLTFHVISGKVLADDVIKANGAMPKTLNGEPLDIRVRGGKVYVNGAQVITADILASNGVIHVIDKVLVPAPAAVPAGR